MARKFRISKTKRIRSLFRRLAEYEVNTIDSFRAHVSHAAAAQQRSIQRRSDKLPTEVQEFLADELQELDAILGLADQLAIVALHRVVEINAGRILAHKFGTVTRLASYSGRLRRCLANHGIKIELIPHYRASNELRLLNNAIKHAGYVTAELADEYPRWKPDSELVGLDAAYIRLKEHVPSYIFRFAERLKLRGK
jgi:hypothetical protein